MSTTSYLNGEASYNPTGLVGALAYYSAAAITSQYLKRPGPLVQG
jgi:gluconate 2-dehydrogenase alpha chain